MAHLFLTTVAVLLSGCGLDYTLIVPEAGPEASIQPLPLDAQHVWVVRPYWGEDESTNPVELFAEADVEVFEVLTRPRMVCRSRDRVVRRGMSPDQGCGGLVRRGTLQYVRIARGDLGIAKELGYSEQSPSSDGR